MRLSSTPGSARPAELIQLLAPVVLGGDAILPGRASMAPGLLGVLLLNLLAVACRCARRPRALVYLGGGIVGHGGGLVGRRRAVGCGLGAIGGQRARLGGGTQS